MSKRIAALVAAMVWMSVVALPAAALQPSMPELTLACKAAILVDQASGTVLYEKNADQPMPVASITKVMTLLLTMDALHEGKISLQDIVPISAHSYSMGGSQIWLEPGEEFTLEELLKAICVSSANDAAVAVAEFVGGSEEVFVSRMNERAAALGMTNTHFCNACGLDESGHVSTARDVAIMSREILNLYPEITEYTTIWMDTLRDGATQLVNTNKLLQRYNGITGLKTGTTGGAGICISASATRDGLELIAVVLGASSSSDRFDAAVTQLDYGFANFENIEAELPPDAPIELPVRHGVESEVTLEYTAPGKVLVQKGSQSEVQTALELPAEIEAPVQAGQQLGSLSVLVNGQQSGVYPVQAAQSVERLDFGAAFERLLKVLLCAGE